MTDTPAVPVALAIVRHGRLWLITRRRPGAHLPNLWEFPGGKICAGETPAVAARRELAEETGVRADAVADLPTVVWDYEDRKVALHPVVCTYSAGTARPLQVADCRWVTLDELAALPLPPANAAILDALQSYLAGPDA